jgi:hypothetical protein
VAVPVEDAGVRAAPDLIAVKAAPPAVPVVAPKKEPPPKVKIAVRASPKAAVTWGKKALGMTPLVLERPQGSGPLDLVLRANGHFPVHVRLYAHRDDKVDVKLTRLSDRMTLFGAKKDQAPPPPTDETPVTP